MKYPNICEEELKNKVGHDFFANFDTTKIVGNIDFCVLPQALSGFQTLTGLENTLLWAEAKKGTVAMLTMISQLVLTIGKARTFDKFLPPAFLGAFDSQKIGFVPYNAIIDVFSINDFNWNVTPSNHKSKEFGIIKDRIEQSLHKNHYVYDFEKDEKELQFFIKNNIAKTTLDAKIAIDKNNFVAIYLRWLEQVKPHIDLDWEAVKKNNIFDREFYLADLFVDDKGTTSMDDDTPLNQNIFVIFKNGHYEIQNKNLGGMFQSGSNTFALKNKDAYEQFWKRYKRPPLEKFQQYILERKDLLVSQDIRERRGAFFTPQKWVALSQQYIADVLGEDWQEEYYVWDCAAGTGNLLAGLTNEYNIWASTLEMADVNVMHERIDNGAKLLKNHCFQFDFLNDDFSKLPQGLQDIINDEEKRKKLVIYINPPYAEATSAKTVTKTSENKAGVTTDLEINDYFKPKIGSATNEIFALFMANIYEKILGCILGQFSTLKFVNSSNFKKFKDFFKADFLKGFVVPADTFDNVKGSFPIGFTLWHTDSQVNDGNVLCDIFDKEANFQGKKLFDGNLLEFVNKWIVKHQISKEKSIGTLFYRGNDFQNQKYIYLDLGSTKAHDSELYLNQNNLIEMSIYLAVRQCINATWLNDRDQFLYPIDGWQSDSEFQNDCLAFALFHSQNKISSKGGTNHWIPFTESEVKAAEKFESNFMTHFIKGKIQQEPTTDLFSSTTNPVRVSNPNRVDLKLEFSEKATAVFDAGRELWKYYHAQPNVNVNASLYDIREHFQGRNDKGKMNNKSADQSYMQLITALRENLKILAKKIEPKVYEYGFLKV